MKRTLTLAAAALALLPAVAMSGATAAKAAAPDIDAPQVFVTNFDSEKDLSMWKAGGDAATSQALSRATGTDVCSTTGSMVGAYGALTGWDPGSTRNAPGAGRAIPLPVATWAQEALTVGARGPVNVEVTWSARSVRDCENCLPAAYIGTAPATQGGDFEVVGALGGGWQQFRYETRANLTGGDALYVALGWMGAYATTGLDCITVRVERARITTENGTKGEAANAERTANGHFYNFEKGLAPWGFGTDSTYGVLQQGHGQNGCSDVAGNAYASISNMAGPLANNDPLDFDVIPIPRDPILYMVAPFQAARAEISHIEVDFASRSIEGCGGCMLASYVGEKAHPRGADFKLLTDGLTAQWQTTHLEEDLLTKPASQIYVALGWQGPTGDLAEGPRDAGFDCVSVRINPPDITDK